MIFSSLIFLYVFLPFTLLGYYFSPYKIKNYWLLLASLVFFAWGGLGFTLILLISIVLNYFFGLAIDANAGRRSAYWWLTWGVTANVLILAIFKYTNFLVETLNELLSTVSISPIPQTNILLPIGISFYTFHSLSYLVDIYRGKTKAQKNIFDLALYICMFSQLIAGPIIRYSDVHLQLRARTHSPEKFASGIERFLIGLAKKVLLANNFAVVADAVFKTDPNSLTALNAWLGLVCYTLQIYCDFAGYSDMAIGLGRMFGFEFMENFNFPYTAKSVKEFWRRWHISLSSFFRDYVYIPLGGDRKGTRRTYINLLIVFFLTGFWHGASWSFVVWGLFHGFFMIVERLGFEKVLQKVWAPLANLYMLLAVMFAWVLFRADTLAHALEYWQAMFRRSSDPEHMRVFMTYINRELLLALAVAVLGAFGFFDFIYRQFSKVLQSEKVAAKIVASAYHLCSILIYASILILCSAYLVVGTYNPFIYYRF